MNKFKTFLMASIAGAPVWLILLALLPRLAVTVPVIAHPERAIYPDSAQYLELKDSLLQSGSFSTRECGPVMPDVFRTPGYPLFLSAVALGPWKLVAATALLQCLIGVITVILVWRWLSILAPGRGAIYGVGLMALDLVYILHTPLILTETLFLLFIVLSFTAFWEALRSPSIRAALVAGIALGIATLVRPVSLYLPLLLAPLLLRSKKTAAVFLVASLLLPGAWMVRNRVIAGQFIFSSIGGISLLKAPAAHITAKLEGISWDKAENKLRAQVDAEKGPYTSTVQKGAAYMAVALPIIKEHPFLCAYVCLRGAVYLIMGTGEEMIFSTFGVDLQSVLATAPAIPMGGSIALMRSYPWIAAVKVGYLLLLLFIYWTTGRGILFCWRDGRKWEASFLAAGLLYFLVISSYQGYYRLRIPMLPLMAAATAYSFRELKNEKHHSGY